MWRNTIKLHFSQYSPPARAVYLVTRALNLDVELVDTDILTNRYLTPEFLKINPQHTIPTLQDGNYTVWDSHAIAGYLVGMYGKNDILYPKNPKKRAIVDQRMHFDTQHLFPRIVEVVQPMVFRGRTSIPANAEVATKRSYRFLEQFLAKSPWLAGHYMTIADLCCVASISTLEYLIPVTKTEFPKLTEFLTRCKRLPYYQEANQRGVDLLGSKIQERLVMTYIKHLHVK